jgi:hypothetical protein
VPYVRFSSKIFAVTSDDVLDVLDVLDVRKEVFLSRAPLALAD